MDWNEILAIIKTELDTLSLEYLLYGINESVTEYTSQKGQLSCVQESRFQSVRVQVRSQNQIISFIVNQFADADTINKYLNQQLKRLKFADSSTGEFFLIPLDSGYRDLNFQIYDNELDLHTDKDRTKLLTDLENAIITQYRAITSIPWIRLRLTVTHHDMIGQTFHKRYQKSDWELGGSFQIGAGTDQQQFEHWQRSHQFAKLLDTNQFKSIINDLIGSMSNQNVIYGKESRLLMGTSAVASLMNFISASFIKTVDNATTWFDDPNVQYFPRDFSLWDDGTLTNGWRTRPFDVLGINSQRMELIHQGFVKNRLRAYSDSGADAADIHAIHSFDGSLNLFTQPTNLVMTAGKEKIANLLMSLDPGIYLVSLNDIFIDKFQNLHLLGYGQYYKQGKLVYGIRQLYLREPLVSFFKKIQKMGSELTVVDNVTACPWLMENVYASSQV